MATDFDTVIIGSGFGGAVSALRLAEGGYRVPVLNEVAAGGAKSIPASRAATGFETRLTRTIEWLARHPPARKHRHRRRSRGRRWSTPLCQRRHRCPLEDFFQAGWPLRDHVWSTCSLLQERLATFCSPPKFPLTSFPIAPRLPKEAAQLAGFGALL